MDEYESEVKLSVMDGQGLTQGSKELFGPEGSSAGATSAVVDKEERRLLGICWDVALRWRILCMP